MGSVVGRGGEKNSLKTAHSLVPPPTLGSETELALPVVLGVARKPRDGVRCVA